MNFSGTITEATGMTMTRLIERIVASDRAGRLVLKDDASGRKAEIHINHGTVKDVTFNEMTGNPALAAIGQTMPWDFEFVPDEAGAVAFSSSITPRAPRSKARAVVRAALPVSAPAPTIAAVSDTADTTGSDQTNETNGTPERRESLIDLPAWVAESSGEHCIRFGWDGRQFLGGIHEDDHDFFRSDFAFLKHMARAVAGSLGMAPPAVIALAEAERATGYCVRGGDGFLAAISGAGGGVDMVIDFPRT